MVIYIDVASPGITLHPTPYTYINVAKGELMSICEVSSHKNKHKRMGRGLRSVGVRDPCELHRGTLWDGPFPDTEPHVRPATHGVS
jgi:hypothetical protein